MPKAVILVVILVLGAAVLAPMVMMLDPDPIPGDFHITLHNARINVPVVYSLCASAVLALFYSIMKR